MNSRLSKENTQSSQRCFPRKNSWRGGGWEVFPELRPALDAATAPPLRRKQGIATSFKHQAMQMGSAILFLATFRLFKQVKTCNYGQSCRSPSRVSTKSLGIAKGTSKEQQRRYLCLSSSLSAWLSVIATGINNSLGPLAANGSCCRGPIKSLEV